MIPARYPLGITRKKKKKKTEIFGVGLYTW
jgi:hypothetical protein